jgi:hypothetical protein
LLPGVEEGAEIAGLEHGLGAAVACDDQHGAADFVTAKWKTGFWGEKSMGWHYDVLMIAMLLVILTMGPGKYSF